MTSTRQGTNTQFRGMEIKLRSRRKSKCGPLGWEAYTVSTGYIKLLLDQFSHMEAKSGPSKRLTKEDLQQSKCELLVTPNLDHKINENILKELKVDSITQGGDSSRPQCRELGYQRLLSPAAVQRAIRQRKALYFPVCDLILVEWKRRPYGLNSVRSLDQSLPTGRAVKSGLAFAFGEEARRNSQSNAQSCDGSCIVSTWVPCALSLPLSFPLLPRYRYKQPRYTPLPRSFSCPDKLREHRISKRARLPLRSPWLVLLAHCSSSLHIELRSSGCVALAWTLPQLRTRSFKFTARQTPVFGLRSMTHRTRVFPVAVLYTSNPGLPDALEGWLPCSLEDSL
ncbi:hypothetical protein ANN_01569 [Periplaneta americana]|uniref:Uncharacterized protein n=1 Tax=Periplaneta americana TaxID=6978 RepID=A0ABQ8TTX4_PERAM|nr:hypothetical protein ANN_01569 [Periplaneta americana]